MNNKVIKIGCLLLGCYLISCSSGKRETDNDSEASDTIAIVVDTVQVEEVEESPKPIRADESFDDFIYIFSSNKKLQEERIVFPLPVYNIDEPEKIPKEAWEHDFFYTKDSLYTLLFDKEEDMDLIGDSELTSVQFEWIFIPTKLVKKYYFERVEGAWLLEAINIRKMEEDDNEQFIDFYSRFATDSVFQMSRITNPITFVTSDPDDDFSILETTIGVNQWLAFKPILPYEKLSNINYGQRNEDKSKTKILALKGIGNGFSNILYFRIRNSRWELYKFEDTSV